MQDDLTWIPSDLVDEVMPPNRPSPDDWIVSLSDGAPALADGREDDEDPHPTALTDGQLVKFASLRSCGRALLTLKREGGWTVDRDMPADAEQVCAMNGWQIETLAGDVDECARALLDAGAEPDDYELSYYTWEHDMPFRFDAATRKFHPATPTQ